MVTRYTRKADQKRRAVAAIEKWEESKSVETCERKASKVVLTPLKPNDYDTFSQIVVSVDGRVARRLNEASCEYRADQRNCVDDLARMANDRGTPAFRDKRPFRLCFNPIRLHARGHRAIRCRPMADLGGRRTKRHPHTTCHVPVPERIRGIAIATVADP